MSEKLIKQLKRNAVAESMDFSGFRPANKFIRHLSNESSKDMRIIAKLIKRVQETRNFDDIQKMSERFNLTFLSDLQDSIFVFVKRDSLTKYESENGVVTITAYKGDSWFKDIDFKKSSDNAANIESLSQFYLSLLDEKQTLVDPIKIRMMDYSIFNLTEKHGIDFFESELYYIFTLNDLALIINKETKEQHQAEIKPLRGFFNKILNVYSKLGFVFYATMITVIAAYSLQSIQIDVIAPYINFGSYVHEVGNTFNLREPIQSIVDNMDSTQFIQIEVINNPNFSIPGRTTIDYRVTDRSNNTRLQSTQVVVEDTTRPSIVPTNISDIIEYDDYRNFNFLRLVTATDNHRVESLNYTLPFEGIPNYKPLGNYDVRYTATDPSGNVATFVRRVTVVDTVPPTFNLDNSTITVNFNEARTYNYTQHAVNVNDNYDASLVRLSFSTNYDYANPGTYPFVITATDQSGNRTSRTLNVQVVDTTPPVLRVANEITLNVDNIGSFDPSTLILEARDNHRIQSITQPSVDVLRNRIGLVSFETVATDPSGNRTSQTTRIRLVDTTPPRIQVLRSSDSYSNRVPSTQEILSMVRVTDNFDSEPTVTWTGSLRAGRLSAFTNTITIIATDRSGNRSTANVQIRITDNMAPQLTFRDAGLTLTVAEAEVSKYRHATIRTDRNYMDFVASVTDNVTPSPLITVELLNDGVYNIAQVGVVSLRYRVTDQAGNISIYTYRITTVANPPSGGS